MADPSQARTRVRAARVGVRSTSTNREGDLPIDTGTGRVRSIITPLHSAPQLDSLPRTSLSAGGTPSRSAPCLARASAAATSNPARAGSWSRDRQDRSMSVCSSTVSTGCGPRADLPAMRGVRCRHGNRSRGLPACRRGRLGQRHGRHRARNVLHPLVQTAAIRRASRSRRSPASRPVPPHAEQVAMPIRKTRCRRCAKSSPRGAGPRSV